MKLTELIAELQALSDKYDNPEVAFTRGELTPEHKESCKKTTFCKEYDGESLHDISRDIHEAFDERFNPVIAEIPVDKYGIPKGVFKVTIDWYSE